MLKKFLRLNEKYPAQVFGSIIFTVIFVITAILAVRDSSRESKAEAFTRNCTLNKGIAVRDLDNKMRCVPTFSAAKKESK